MLEGGFGRIINYYRSGRSHTQPLIIITCLARSSNRERWTSQCQQSSLNYGHHHNIITHNTTALSRIGREFVRLGIVILVHTRAGRLPGNHRPACANLRHAHGEGGGAEVHISPIITHRRSDGYRQIR